MEKITFSLSPSLLKDIDERAETKYDNRSEALREIIRKGLNYDSEITRLENRINELTKTAQQTSKMDTQTKEIVEETKGFMDYIEKKQRTKDRANLLKRLKWKLLGFNEEEILEEPGSKEQDQEQDQD